MADNQNIVYSQLKRILEDWDGSEEPEALRNALGIGRGAHKRTKRLTIVREGKLAEACAQAALAGKKDFVRAVARDLNADESSLEANMKKVRRAWNLHSSHYIGSMIDQAMADPRLKEYVSAAIRLLTKNSQFTIG
jgi:hypothetical protein